MEENKVQNTMESFKLNSAPKIRLQVIDQAGRAHGVGRRKSSVAKVWVRAGEGKFTVNGIGVNEYFKAQTHLTEANRPFSLIDQKFDVIAFSKGGGHTGQSGAVSLAISRALVAYNPQYYTVLRSFGLMTFDNRQVERKKAGLVKARKAKPTSRR
jgi:small subunit ribosomal protein S9